MSANRSNQRFLLAVLKNMSIVLFVIIFVIFSLLNSALFLTLEL